MDEQKRKRIGAVFVMALLLGRPGTAQEPNPAPGLPSPSMPPGAYSRGGESDPDEGVSITPPPLRGRPRPGSIFDPGAAGPGISQSGEDNFLDGALDPKTGWPFVFRDHFKPRPEKVERFWIVQTRDCPQEMGSDPWPRLKVLHFDERCELVEHDPNELFAQTVGRPVLIQVQGSLTTPDIALGGLLWTESWLRHNRALTADAVVIAFDWPSERIYKNGTRDINEKGRRAYVAGYHLARFVLGFPAGSRICLLGQSYGGRVVPSALHLLGGGCLDSQSRDAPVHLPAIRNDQFLRAVIIAGASDRNWLDPGQRLDRALVACEGFLNLYNSRDEALRLYPFLTRSNHHRALGRVGLSNHDLEKLGPLAARYAEQDVHDALGIEHSLLDAVANPQVARSIAPYLFNPNPATAPPQTTTETRDRQLNLGRSNRRMFGSQSKAN